MKNKDKIKPLSLKILSSVAVVLLFFTALNFFFGWDLSDWFSSILLICIGGFLVTDSYMRDGKLNTKDIGNGITLVWGIIMMVAGIALLPIIPVILPATLNGFLGGVVGLSILPVIYQLLN